MGKEVRDASYLHYLAHRLLRDPREEIAGALEEVTNKTWTELRGKDVSVLEAEVKDVQVKVEENNARYNTHADSLPENYKDAGGRAPDDDEDDAEVSYAKPDAGWDTAKKDYEKDVEKRVQANIMGNAFFPVYPTAEMAERVKNYSIAIGSLSFVMYEIKSKNF